MLLPAAPDFPPSTVIISGLTIANGDARNVAGGSFGGGGGILSEDALSVSNSVFEANHAQFDGGAIDQLANPNLSLNSDLFEDNSAGSTSDATGFQEGGAVAATSAAVNSCAFVDNKVNGQIAVGGAMVVDGALTIAMSNFQGNSAVGSDIGDGGAVYQVGGQITIDASRFTNNLAQGADFVSPAFGGAIDSTAQNFFSTQFTQTINNSVFTGNRAVGVGGSQGTAEGGAIYNDLGALDVTGCQFVADEALGADSTGSAGGNGNGGAIGLQSSALELTADTFLRNVAQAGSSPLGTQFGFGGAVFSTAGVASAVNSTSTINRSVFSDNEALAGNGGGGPNVALAGGGALAFILSPVEIGSSSFLGNQAISGQGPVSGASTEAHGGAMLLIGTTVTIENSVILGNSAVGGSGGNAQGAAGGAGANAFGGAIASEFGNDLTISFTTIAGNRAVGGDGGTGSVRGPGGDGLGGAIENDASSTLVVTGGAIIGNVAMGGTGGGDGFGGGVYTLGVATLTDVLVTLNVAVGGSGSARGVG